MGEIRNEHVQEFRDLYVKAVGMGIETDEQLKALLENAYSEVVSYSDEFDLDTHPTGKQLVYDAARYRRANASELFYPNFKSQLNGFGFELMIAREGEQDGL